MAGARDGRIGRVVAVVLGVLAVVRLLRGGAPRRPGPPAAPPAREAPTARAAPSAPPAAGAGDRPVRAAPPPPPRRRRHVPATVAVLGSVGAVLLGIATMTGDDPDGDAVPVPGAASATGAPPPVAPPGLLPTGVYIDPGDRRGFEEFATWLGRRPDLVSDGLEEGRWEAVSDPWWLLDAWRDVDAHIVYSLVMIPREEGGSLQEGAAGAYDRHFRTLARRLIDGGQANAILRPGWEFSGDWQPWSARSDPAAWKRYYRRIVDVMRAVPGAGFSFVWNPAAGPIDPDNWPAERAWPGRRWVDLVGLDPYDICFSEGTYPIPAGASEREADRRRAACWRELLHGERGLEWYADFAERHRRPLVIPEYGLVPRRLGGGGDNPLFIRGMARFVRERGVAWAVYFNKADAELGNHSIDDGTYPRSSALFRTLHGPQPGATARP
jgi:hypothetical protein